MLGKIELLTPLTVALNLKQLYRKWDRAFLDNKSDIEQIRAAIDSAEEMIVSLPSHSLPDAVAQLMVVAGWIGSLASVETDAAVKVKLDKSINALGRILSYFAGTQGMDLTDIGAASHLPLEALGDADDASREALERELGGV
jgi:hypothetical protein